MRINWSWNETVRFRGAQWSVQSRTADGTAINLLHLADNRCEVVLEAELVTAYANGGLERMGKPMAAVNENRQAAERQPLEDRSEAAVKEAERRSHYVKEWVKRRYRKRRNVLLRQVTAEVAERISDPKRPSARTFRRWLDRWFAQGAPDLRDARSLMPMWHCQGNTDPRFHPKVLELIEANIKEHLLKPERKPVETIHGFVQEAAENLDTEGVEPCFLDGEGKFRVPSIRTFYEIAKHIPKDILIRSQRGAEEADAKTRPILKGPVGGLPLQEVEFDHTLLDVMVLDTTRNVVLGRPWVTIALDRSTRIVVGWHIGFDAPGTYSVMRTMHHLILPKEHERLADPKLEHANPAYGVPHLIVLDNAPEFHGYSLRTACLSLNIDIRYSPRAKAWYKGKVERWFHTAAKQFFHTIPGTTFSNAKERGRYKSEKMAVLTLDDLRKLFTRYVNDIYHTQWNDGLGGAPLPKWLELVQHPNAVVSLPASVRELDVLLARVEERKLTNRGIEIYGLHYCEDTPRFRELINRPDIPPTVRVWVDDDDLATIRIQDWRTKEYLTVPCTDMEYAKGLSRSAHDLVLARYRRDKETYRRATIKDLIRCKRELHEEIRKLADLKRKSKRTARAFGDLDEQTAKPTRARAKAADMPPASECPPARPKPRNALRKQPAAVARIIPAVPATPTDDLVSFAVRQAIRFSDF